MSRKINKKPRLPFSDQQVKYTDIKMRIAILKAQFFFMSRFNKLEYNDDTFRTAVIRLCGTTARYYGMKFNRKAENIVDEINKLNRALNPGDIKDIKKKEVENLILPPDAEMVKEDAEEAIVKVKENEAA